MQIYGNLTTIGRLLEESQKSVEDVSARPLCFIKTATLEDYCEVLEVSALFFLILGACFIYQLVVVWCCSYHYSLCNERRLQIMLACIFYCTCK